MVMFDDDFHLCSNTSTSERYCCSVLNGISTSVSLNLKERHCMITSWSIVTLMLLLLAYR